MGFIVSRVWFYSARTSERRVNSLLREETAERKLARLLVSFGDYPANDSGQQPKVLALARIKRKQSEWQHHSKRPQIAIKRLHSQLARSFLRSPCRRTKACNLTMKIITRVGTECFAIPCAGDETVNWLAHEALRRFTRRHPEQEDELDTAEVRKTRGGALLDRDDPIKTVLDDEEHVSIGLTDRHGYPLQDQNGRALPGELPERYGPLEYLLLDGDNLSCEDLHALGLRQFKIRLTKKSEKLVAASRDVLERIVEENKVVYGVTTGFGKFARTVVPKQDLEELQLNLIRSHAAGVGDCLPIHRIRMMLALRINVLAKGYSGMSPRNLHKMIDIFNASCLSYVPEQGTVGASGDLAPLAHLALGMMGEGKMWSPETGWTDAKFVLENHKLEPIVLGPKEGIALINGTQLIAALGAEAILRAENAALQADVIAALSLEVLKGTTRAFDAAIHYARPHKGQIAVAERFRALLHSNTHPSEIALSHRFQDRVQDAYTLRCCPQVHGIVHDTIEFAKNIMTTELNSATDNPMVFADRGETMSGGNFHDEYPAKALDYLAIGIHEAASMSERRIERLCNPALSELPAFLTNNGGLNNGFMVAHCTAAALVYPLQQQQRIMFPWADGQLEKPLLAIELLAACQAIEFLRPLKTTAPLEHIHKLVRNVVAPWHKDRFMSPDIEAAIELITSNKVWLTAKPHIDHYVNQEPDRIFACQSPTTCRSRSASLA